VAHWAAGGCAFPKRRESRTGSSDDLKEAIKFKKLVNQGNWILRSEADRPTQATVKKRSFDLCH
jgi:hypothetical protein